MLINTLHLPSTLPGAIWLLVSFSCLGQVAPPGSSPKPVANLTGIISLRGVTGGPVKIGQPDSRLLAETTFVVQEQARVAATFTTDSQGQFHASLPAGHYTIVKKDWKSHVGFFGPFVVDLREGETKTVHWVCETGMQ